MSRRQVPDATLLGMIGPLYPTRIESINDAVGGTAKTVSTIRLHGYRQAFAATGWVEIPRGDSQLNTSDGYDWCLGAERNHNSVRIVVLFPWHTDSSQKDDTRMDRSVAIYTSGSITIQKLNELCLELSIGLNDAPQATNQSGIRKAYEG